MDSDKQHIKYTPSVLFIDDKSTFSLQTNTLGAWELSSYLKNFFILLNK